MTNSDKTNIAHLRNQGFSYKRISEMLSLNENNVSSYCKRHGLGGRKPKPTEQPKFEVASCLYCGNMIQQMPHRKVKKYCSDACRMKWWNSHSKNINRKSQQEFTCPVCGDNFTAYASANQTYCSRNCYAKSKGG